jgi:hydrogenase maturation protease
MKTLIIGLGNPILGDDGVGWVVAEQVRAALLNPQSPIPDPQSIEVDTASLGGLSLMERLTDAQRVILVDAIFTGTVPVGTVSRFLLDELPNLSAGHSASAHDTSLRNALQVGRDMHVPLPKDEDVTIVTVEAENVYDFSQNLSPAVAAAVPLALQHVLELINH